MAERRVVRTKTSAAVVGHVIDALFAGTLRSGDRIDLDDMSETLGISRLPVREAMVMLERDGIVSTKYHRGVFVEPFDAESILDDFEIMGLLSGIALRRLAEQRDPETLARLDELLHELEAADPKDRNAAFELVQAMMILEHRTGGSRRLRAQLRSYVGFLPQSFALIDRDHAVTVKAHRRVIRAIVAGDGDEAARHRLEDFRDAGRSVVQELTRRGVITSG